MVVGVGSERSKSASRERVIEVKELVLRQFVRGMLVGPRYSVVLNYFLSVWLVLLATL